jgi:DnaK suppressor protein
MALTKKQMKLLSEKISSEKTRIVKSLGESNTEYITPKDEVLDESDQAKYYYDQAQDIRFRNRELFYLKKLDKAQDRINNDEDFGCCEECGADIRFERLMARPTAEMCIVCKDDAERVENSNFIGKKSKSMGETMATA